MIENVFAFFFFSKRETLTARIPSTPLTQQQKKLLFTVLRFSQKRDEIHVNSFEHISIAEGKTSEHL